MNQNQAKISSETKSMVQAAREGARILLAMRHEVLDVVEKGDHDIATIADFKAQEAILEILYGNHPDIPVVAEEQKGKVFPSDTFFTVDPLDNTLAYQSGYAYGWGSIIGFVENGQVRAGVIYLPMEDQMFVVEKGKGCYLNDQLWQISYSEPFGRSVIDIEIGPWLDSHCFTQVVKPLTDSCGLVKSNESVVGVDVLRNRLALWVFVRGEEKVAGGIWDFTAPALAIEEAGGFACDTKGQPLVFDKISMNGVVFGASEAIKESAMPLMRDW